MTVDEWVAHHFTSWFKPSTQGEAPEHAACRK